LIDLVRRGEFRKGQNIVFIHTGGIAGLFGYVEDFGFTNDGRESPA
jgi:L-cysteate sulfo-lyase